MGSLIRKEKFNILVTVVAAILLVGLLSAPLGAGTSTEQMKMDRLDLLGLDTEDPAVAEAARDAMTLHSVDVFPKEGNINVVLHLSGLPTYDSYLYPENRRLVVDLRNTINLSPSSVFELGEEDPIRTVRNSQYRVTPSIISRVVLELDENAAPEITVDGDNLIISTPMTEVASSESVLEPEDATASEKIAVPAVEVETEIPEIEFMLAEGPAISELSITDSLAAEEIPQDLEEAPAIEESSESLVELEGEESPVEESVESSSGIETPEEPNVNVDDSILPAETEQPSESVNVFGVLLEGDDSAIEESDESIVEVEQDTLPTEQLAQPVIEESIPAAESVESEPIIEVAETEQPSESVNVIDVLLGSDEAFAMEENSEPVVEHAEQESPVDVSAESPASPEPVETAEPVEEEQIPVIEIAESEDIVEPAESASESPSVETPAADQGEGNIMLAMATDQGKPEESPASELPTMIAQAQYEAPEPVEDVEPADVEEEIVPEETLVTLTFKDAKLSSVLDILARKGELNILAGKDIRGSVTVRLVDVPLDVALNAILNVNGYGYMKTDNIIRILPLSQVGEKVTTLTETYTLSYASACKTKDTLKGFLTTNGNIEVDERTNMLIVTDVPGNMDRIRKLIPKIDTRVQQVLIEVLILDSVLVDNTDLGISWRIFNTKDNSTDILGDPDSFTIPFGFPEVQALELSFGTLMGDIKLESFIQAVVSDTEAQVLANPKLLTLNNEKANIEIITEYPYQELTQSSSGGQLATTSFKEVGTKLEVTPQITHDGYVILTVVPEQSNVVDVDEFSHVPIVATRTAETTLIIKDNQTLVMGGLRENRRVKSMLKVPFLGDMPGVKYIFRSVSSDEEDTELLVFITVHIVESPQLLVDDKMKFDELANIPRNPSTVIDMIR